MRLVPRYSYEFNKVLNEGFDDKDQIQNFASLISDKERFFALIPYLHKNKELIEKALGYELPDRLEFYVVRAEKFKSFSEPVTIEYSLNPEEMLLFLLKEIAKVSIKDRFPDDLSREEYINSFIDYVVVNGEWDDYNIIRFAKLPHSESERMYTKYKYVELDFDNKSIKDYLYEQYNE